MLLPSIEVTFESIISRETVLPQKLKKMNRNGSIGYYTGNKTLTMAPSNTALRLCSCNAVKLEDELMQLRESTKHALKASWDEVETLQCENSKLIEKNARFEIDLAKLREELQDSKSR